MFERGSIFYLIGYRPVTLEEYLCFHGAWKIEGMTVSELAGMWDGYTLEDDDFYMMMDNYLGGGGWKWT